MTFHRGKWAALAVAMCAITPVPGSDVAAATLAFENVTAQQVDQLADSTYRFDAMWTDFNSDGCLDAFVYDHGFPTPTSRLWLNRCDGSARLDLVSNSDVNYYIGNPMNPRGSGWVTTLDFDGDGREDFWTRDSDLPAARYRNGSTPGSHMPWFSGKDLACDYWICAFGDFTGVGALQIVDSRRQIEDMMTRNVIRPASGDEAYQVVGDVTGNGWPDIVQPANGGYWRNDSGTLTWQAVPAFRGGGSGVQLLADFDNDGYQDLMLVDVGRCGGPAPVTRKVLLFRNNGQGGFTDISSSIGELTDAGAPDCWANYGNIIAADMDNDGYLDVVYSGGSNSSSTLVFRNNGNLTFSRSSVNFGASGGTSAGGGWVSASPRAGVGDFDNDGRLDIVKTQHPSNVGIWRNVTNTEGANWLKVRVRGVNKNTDGVGANVRIYRTGTSQIVANLEVQVSDQHPLKWLHAGLGARDRVDVEVRFPSGGPTHRFNGIPANQEVIAYANGCLLQNWRPGNGWPVSPPSDCSFSGGSTRARRNGATPLSPPAADATAATERGTTAAPARQAITPAVAPATAAGTGVATTASVIRVTPAALLLWRRLQRWFDTVSLPTLGDRD
ncbi:FG-GAP repeat domain-containing protein [Luteimonas marina]|nr:VCBS repeat-containing protein [Luteimonas marina]